MKALDCPHCFTRVLVLDDSICPHCKEDVRKATGAGSALCKLRIHDQAHLPDNCLHCDAPTQRRVVVERCIGVDREGRHRTLALLTALFAPLSALKMLSRASKVSTGQIGEIRIEVPQCDVCSQRGRPRPHEVDFENFEMVFLVHKGFYDRVKRQVTLSTERKA